MNTDRLPNGWLSRRETEGIVGGPRGAGVRDPPVGGEKDGRTRRRNTLGLSWPRRRVSGLSLAKAKASRKLGFPLSRPGRQRRFGTAAGGRLPLVVLVGSVAAGAAWWWLT